MMRASWMFFEVGMAVSRSGLLWIYNCPATNITPANATANIALANWLPSSITDRGYRRDRRRGLPRRDGRTRRTRRDDRALFLQAVAYRFGARRRWPGGR